MRCVTDFDVPPGLCLVLCILASAILFSPASIQANGGLTWPLVCDELADYQDYGVATMIADCKAAESPSPCGECDTTCSDRWMVWTSCRLNGNSAEDCHDDRVAAMACRACYEGDVDADGADQLLWVNAEACEQGNPNPSGSHIAPFCEIGPAIVAAHADQDAPDPKGTKIAVCPAVYREEIEETVTVGSSAPPVILESVVQHEAVIRGSEEWNDGWQQANPPGLSYQNLLPYSEDFSAAAGWDPQIGANSFALPRNITGPDGSTILATEITPGPGEPSYFEYDVPSSLGTGRYVFSIYTRVLGRSLVGVKIEGTGSDQASYKISLPPAPCTAGPAEGANGFGYELLDPNPQESGDEWYRIWLADSLLTHGKVMAPHEALASVRIEVEADPGYLDQYHETWLWGAQLERRPVGSFATEPRPYLPTAGMVESDFADEFPIYEISGWTKDWGAETWHTGWGCPVPEPTMLRAEQLFIDGEPLLQVLRKDDMVPGSYFIDDGLTYEDHTLRWPANGTCIGSNEYLPPRPAQCSQTPCTIYLAPGDVEPSWDSGAGHYAFQRLEISERSKTLWLTDSNDWTVRGMRFDHAAGDVVQGASALFLAAQSLEFIDNLAVHNSGTGFGIHGELDCKGVCDNTLKGEMVYATETKLTRNRAFDNGTMGASLWAQQGVVVTDEHYARNNWRGERVGHRGGFVGGSKMGWIDGGDFSNLRIEDNHGNGLWFDHFGVDIDIVDLTATGNQGAGLYLERHNNLIPSGLYGLGSNSPATYTFRVTDSTLSHNRVGLKGADAVHVEVERSFFERNHDPGNNGAQVAAVWTHFLDDSSPEGIPDGLHDWSLTDNTYTACSTDVFYFYSDTEHQAAAAIPGSRLFMKTLESDDNVFEADASLGNRHGFINGVEPIDEPNPASFNLDIWHDYTSDIHGHQQDKNSCVVGVDCP